MNLVFMHTGEIDLIKKFHFSVFLILGFVMNLACGILEKTFLTPEMNFLLAEMKNNGGLNTMVLIKKY